MFERLRIWLSDLVSGRDMHKEDIADVLRASLFVSILVGVVALAVAVLVPGWERLIRDAGLALGLSLSLWILMRHGYIRLAAMATVIGFAAIAVFTAISDFGVRGTGYFMLILVVIGGALLIHRFVAFVVAILSSLFGLILISVGPAGGVPNAGQPMSETATWLIVSMYFIIAAAMLNMALRQRDRALARMAQSTLELEQRIAERTMQLGLSEQRYRLIAENADDMIWTTDMHLHPTYISPSFQRALGYLAEELTLITPERVLTPASLKNALTVFEEETAHASPQPDPAYTRVAALEFRRKDGTTFLGETKFVFLRDIHSNLSGVLGVSRDITERNRMEAALRASEERYRLISSVSSDYMFSTRLNEQGQLVLNWVTGAFEKITGYTFEEYSAHGGWRACLHPDDLAQDDRDFAQLSQNEPVITDVRTITKSGQIRWVRVYAHPVWDVAQNRLTGIYGAVQDITNHKEAEATLRASEQRFRVLVEQLPVITYTDDVTTFGKTNYISPQIKSFLGITPEAWISGELNYWVEHIHPDDRTRAVQEFENCFYKGLPVDSEYRLRAEDGREVWFHDRSVRVADVSGQPQYILGVMTDITERKRSEIMLEQQAAQLTVLHQLGQEIVASLDLEQVYVSAHHAVEQLLSMEAFYISLVDQEHQTVQYDYLFDKGQRFPAESLPLNTPNLTSHVLKTGEALFIVDDAQGQSQSLGVGRFGTLEDTRSVMIVPLKFSGEVIGTISAQHYQPNMYSAEHLKLLTLLANQVAIAVQNARLVQSLRLQTAALEATANAIVITNRDNIIQWVNPAFTRLTGYTAAEVIGHNPNLLRSGRHDQAFYQQLWATLNAGEVWRGEIINRRKDGSLYTEEQIITPVQNEYGHIFRYIAIKQDITARKLAEENLRHERHLLQALMDNIPDTIYFKDRESRFTRINHAQAHLLGLASPEAAIGRTDLDFQDTTLGQQFFAEEQALLATGIPLINRVEYNPLPDGSPRWLTATKVPLRDLNGAIVGLVGISRDITAYKLAEEREQRRREMLERVVDLGKAVTQITDLIPCLREIHRSVQHGLGFDRVGLFLYDSTNRQVRGAFGTSATGALEDTSWFKQSVTEYEAWQGALSNPRGMSVIDNYQAFRQVDPNDEMQDVQQHVTLAAWAGDQPLALITADNAITQRRFTNEQLEALQLFAGYAGLAIKNAQWNDELERRVLERTTALESANRELESLSYTIAHDLRSPVRAMVGYSQMLGESHAAQLDESGRADLEHILRESKRMGQLVDDFLTFLRLARRPLRRQTLAMTATIERVWNQLQAHRAGRAIEITIGALPEVQADAELLEQVWLQFIANALKFTRPRAQAHIEIGSVEKDGERCYYIRDNGIGFDMRFADKLFSIFQRLNRQEEFEGTGIGLAIAQRIVHKHGGRIWAEGEVDKGATFYFTLG